MKTEYKLKTQRLSSTLKDSRSTAAGKGSTHRPSPTTPKETKLVSFDKNFIQRVAFPHQALKKPVKIVDKKPHFKMEATFEESMKNLTTTASENFFQSPLKHED